MGKGEARLGKNGARLGKNGIGMGNTFLHFLNCSLVPFVAIPAVVLPSAMINSTWAL